jgi:hypothetical protein
MREIRRLEVMEVGEQESMQKMIDFMETKPAEMLEAAYEKSVSDLKKKQARWDAGQVACLCFAVACPSDALFAIVLSGRRRRGSNLRDWRRSGWPKRSVRPRRGYGPHIPSTPNHLNGIIGLAEEERSAEKRVGPKTFPSAPDHLNHQAGQD